MMTVYENGSTSQLRIDRREVGTANAVPVPLPSPRRELVLEVDPAARGPMHLRHAQNAHRGDKLNFAAVSGAEQRDQEGDRHTSLYPKTQQYEPPESPRNVR